MTKQELWTAGKSLLQQAGMPEAQCRSFVGKLCKDYTDAVVIEAVRTAVVEQPADPASFLKAVCKKQGGKSKADPASDLAARQAETNAEAKRLLGIHSEEVIDV